jgi:4-diphosphocytidyl-2-C-methyl-D-erythritol kinase
VPTVTVRVPAKVNLQLSVGPLRPDGYHDLVNVFHAVSIYDEIVATDADTLTISVEGGPSDPVEGVPTDGRNLAARAASALASHLGIDRGVHLTLRKRIPVAGGMAGGSADAAAALVACDALWETGLSRSELDVLAAELGADVPFALMGGTAMGLGRGDQLSPVLARGQFHWVFAFAEEGLPTPAVYAECDRLRRDVAPPVLRSGGSIAASVIGQKPFPRRAPNEPHDETDRAAGWPQPQVNEPLMAALRSGDARALGRALVNDLQPAALSLRPQLARTLDAADRHGVLGSVVSGSGPTCAFLVGSVEDGLDLAVGLTAMGLCRDVMRAVGPVPGARVVS